MVLLIVAVCWCRGNRYIPSKCTFYRIMYHNRAQTIIQCHDNNIWKQICIKKLSYSPETYLRYNVQRGKTGQKIHVSSKSRIGPIPTNKTMYQRMRSNVTSWAGTRQKKQHTITLNKICSRLIFLVPVLFPWSNCLTRNFPFPSRNHFEMTKYQSKEGKLQTIFKTLVNQ